MFIKCSVDSQLSIGDIVEYDATASKWVALSSASASPWGVVVSEPQEDGTEGSTQHIARVQFAGACFARLSRDVPDQGGALAVETGGAYVDASGDCGLIAPCGYNDTGRLAGALALIHIR